MGQLLYTRELIVRFIKKYEVVFLFILKLVTGMLIFGMVNGIGFYNEKFKLLFDSAISMPFYLLISLLFALSPPTLACTLVAAMVVVQISSALIPMVFIGLLLALILILYCRVSPERCLLIIAMLIGYKFNMPYAVVIFAGLYLGLSSIAPITIAVFIQSFIPFFAGLVKSLPTPADIGLDQIPVTALDTYKLIFEAMTGDFSWVFTAFVFAIVVLAVYAISRLFTDYCVEIAVAAGSVINIIGFICEGAFISSGPSIFLVIIMTVISAALVEGYHFFDIVLDYDRAERVQFEDDDNYYYVKIVPKIKAIPEEKPGPVKKARSISAGKSPSARDAAKKKEPLDLRVMFGLQGGNKKLPPVKKMNDEDDEE